MNSRKVSVSTSLWLRHAKDVVGCAVVCAIIVILFSPFVLYARLYNEEPPDIERPVVHLVQRQGESTQIPLEFPHHLPEVFQITSSTLLVSGDTENFGHVSELLVYKTPWLRITSPLQYYVVTYQDLPAGEYNVTVSFRYKLNAIKEVDQTFRFATLKVTKCSRSRSRFKEN